MIDTHMKIGFIGQGFVGKAYADDFEKRGLTVVRYALEEPYRNNKVAIGGCDIVFIAVPTPTTPEGFDDSIIRSAVGLVGKGKIAVIKSTIVPGTTASIQAQYPDRAVFHSPEFLTEKTAAYDAAHPDRNIIGIPKDTEEYKAKARFVIDVLPKAPYELICDAKAAELIKYGGNCWFYVKVVYVNMLHDLATAHGLEWGTIQEALTADARIGPTHLNPVHQGGRGAGGHCFIKDFEAFRREYEKTIGDAMGKAILSALVEKNNHYLRSTGKNLDLLKGVYGDKVLCVCRVNDQKAVCTCEVGRAR
jgi:nucleotide sugar dehydrogenase